MGKYLASGDGNAGLSDCRLCAAGASLQKSSKSASPQAHCDPVSSANLALWQCKVCRVAPSARLQGLSGDVLALAPAGCALADVL
jgi:hypothetical protein